MKILFLIIGLLILNIAFSQNRINIEMESFPVNHDTSKVDINEPNGIKVSFAHDNCDYDDSSFTMLRLFVNNEPIPLENKIIYGLPLQDTAIKFYLQPLFDYEYRKQRKKIKEVITNLNKKDVKPIIERYDSLLLLIKVDTLVFMSKWINPLEYRFFGMNIYTPDYLGDSIVNGLRKKYPPWKNEIIYSHSLCNRKDNYYILKHSSLILKKELLKIDSL